VLAAALSTVGWTIGPRLFGLTAVTVSSGSMEPGIGAGDLLFINSSGRVAEGHIALFPAPATGDPTTHRIESVNDDATITTKGDANANPDTDPVPIDTVLGVAQFRLPLIGGAGPGVFLAMALGATLATFAIAAMFPGERPQRRRRRGSAVTATAAAVAAIALLASHSPPVAATLAGVSTNGANSWSTIFNPTQLLGPATTPAVATPNFAIAGTVYASATYQGVVYLGGDFTSVAGSVRVNLAAIDLGTGAVTAWNPAPPATGAGLAGIYSLAVDPARGVLYAGGTFTSIAGSARNRLAAFDLTTPGSPALIGSWNPNMGSTVRSVAIDGGAGVVYAGGDFVTVGVASRQRIAAWSAVTAAGGGGVLTSFAPPVPSGGVFAIAVNSSAVYFGGTFTSMWGSPAQNRLAAANKATAAAVPTFTANASANVYALAIGGAGTLWAGGTFTTIGGSARVGVAQLSPVTGSQDLGINRSASAGQVNTLVYDSSRDLMYVGGTFTVLGGVARSAVAVVPTTPATGSVGVPIGWDPNPNGGTAVTQTAVAPAAATSITTVFTVAINDTATGTADTGAAVIGGNFTTLADTERQSYAVTTSAPTVTATNNQPLATGIDVGVTGQVLAQVQVGTTLYIGGNFTWVAGQPRDRVAAIDTTTGDLLAWAPSVTGPGLGSGVVVNALAAHGGYIYIGGSFAAVNGTPRLALAAVSATTGAVTSFAATFSGGTLTVWALTVDPVRGQLFVGGAFTTAPKPRLAAFSLTDPALPVLDSGWTPTPNGLVRTIAVDSVDGSIYVGGDFTVVGGVAAPRLAKFAPIGSGGALATGFAPVPGNAVTSLSLAPSPGPGLPAPTIYLGGTFTTVTGPGASGGVRNRAAAVATANGAVSAFDPNAQSTVNAIAVSASGNDVYLGGAFTLVGGVARQRIAAVTATTGALAAAWVPVSAYGAGSVLALTLDAVTADRVWVGGDFRAAFAGSAARESLAVVGGAPTGPATSPGWDLPTAAPLGTVTDMVSANGVAYVGGAFRFVSGVRRLGVAGIDLDTNALTSFDALLAASTPTSSPTVAALATNGAEAKLYVGGDLFDTSNGVARARLAVFDTATGALDTAFTSPVSAIIRDIEVNAATGEVYLGGDFSGANAVGTLNRSRLARLTAAGTPDATFAPPSPNNAVNSLALTADGATLFLGGTFTAFAAPAATRLRAAAITVATAALTPFDPAANNVVTTLELANDEQTIYLGGSFTTVNAGAIATPGALAAVWPSTGAQSLSLAQPGTASVAAIQEEAGLLVVGGGFTTLGGVAVARVGGLDILTGAADTTFIPVFDTVLSVNALASGPPGELLLGGRFQLPNSNGPGGWARLRSTVSVPIGWSTAPAVTTVAPTAVAPLAVNAAVITGTTLHVGGTFTSVDGEPRRRYATVDSKSAALGPATPGFDGTVSALEPSPGALESAGRVYVGGAFSTVNEPSGTRYRRLRIAAIDLATGHTAPWSPSIGSGATGVLALAAVGLAVYAGGDFTAAVGGAVRNRLASFDALSGAVTAFNPNMSSTVTALEVGGDGTSLYAGGAFTTVNGVQRNRLAAFGVASGTLATFNPNMSSTVRTLVFGLGAEAATLYAGGDFSGAAAVGGSITRNRAAAFNTATGDVTAWDPNITNGAVHVLRPVPFGDVVAGGTFTTVNGSVARARFAGFNTGAGSVSALNPGAVGSSVLAITVDPGALRLAVAGSYTTLDGVPRSSFAMLGPSS